jgi:hypothetical protein
VKGCGGTPITLAFKTKQRAKDGKLKKEEKEGGCD